MTRNIEVNPPPAPSEEGSRDATLSRKATFSRNAASHRRQSPFPILLPSPVFRLLYPGWVALTWRGLPYRSVYTWVPVRPARRSTASVGPGNCSLISR